MINRLPASFTDVVVAEAGVFSEHEAVRAAAAGFVEEHAKACGTPLQLRSLVQLAVRQLGAATVSLTSEDEEGLETADEYVRGFDGISTSVAVMSWLVDAFWALDSVQPLLQDWAGIVALLLSDERAVLETDQFLMLALLSSSARRAAGLDLLQDKVSTLEAAEPCDDLASMTLSIADKLSLLLTKFQSDPQKVCAAGIVCAAWSALQLHASLCCAGLPHCYFVSAH